ncbi:MAG: SET domain-containing protein [Planctomycetota bacterium]
MFKVQTSGIHGRGLFADRFIPEGTVIGHLEGHYTTQDGSYVLWITEDQGFRVKNELRFINHDAEPNAAYYDDLTVGAIRDIQPGEEITHNYLGDEDAEDVEHGFDEWPEDEVMSINQTQAQAVGGE